MFAPFKTLSITAFAAASLIAGSANAETFMSNGRTFEVNFGDLDLSRVADQKELQARIGKAASKVCSGTSLQESSRCRSAAIAHVQTPVASAIARAETRARYADAATGGYPALTH